MNDFIQQKINCFDAIEFRYDKWDNNSFTWFRSSKVSRLI